MCCKCKLLVPFHSFAGLLLGVVLAISCPVGIAIAAKLNGEIIKVVVSIVLIIAAAVLFANTIPRMVAEANANTTASA